MISAERRESLHPKIATQWPLPLGERGAVIDVLPRMLRCAGDEPLVAATELPPRLGRRGGTFGRLLAHGGSSRGWTSVQRCASMVGTRAVASVSNSSGVAVPSSTNVLPPASVTSPYRALPDVVAAVAVVVERPLDAVDRDRARRERARQQPGDPGGVRLESLVHADVLVARREVARVPGGHPVDVGRAQLGGVGAPAVGEDRHRERVVGARPAPARRPRRRRCRVPSGCRCAARGARSRAPRAGSRRARGRGSAPSALAVLQRVLGLAGGRLLGRLGAAELGDDARGRSVPSAHAGVVGCRGGAAPAPARAASRRAFAPISHSSQRAASASPRSHSASDCSRVADPCSSSATTRTSSSRACS